MLFILFFYNFGIYCVKVAIIQGIQYIRNIIIPSVKTEIGRLSPPFSFSDKKNNRNIIIIINIKRM